MAILSIQIGATGTANAVPQVSYINTNDTVAAITASGYLNNAVAEGFVFQNGSLCAVSSQTSPSSTTISSGWYTVQISGGNTTLVATTQPGDVVLPTKANHIATFLDTTGTIGEDVTTAINGGNIQAGLATGTAGTVASYPGTASEGALILKAVNNSGGNFNTTISNASSVGQSQVVSIPDQGGATGNFITSGSTGLQTISSALTVTGALTSNTSTTTLGNVVAGASGTAGNLQSFPAAASEGELIVAAVSNSGGNFNTTISNAASVGQSQVISIPDSGATTANFILSKSGSAQHITTSGLAVDAGSLTAGLAAGGTAGGLTLYPATASNGSFVLTPVGNAGNFAATVSPVSTLGQASVYTIPDPAAATANIAVAPSALVSGNFVKASGTAGLVIDSGIATAPASGVIGVPYVATVVMNTAAVVGAYTTPVQIIAAPGASVAIIVISAQIITETSTAFATGGVAQLQYGNTNHAGGTICTSATIAAAEITAATSQIFTQAPIAAATVLATATYKNLGIFFTNATQAFTSGTGSTITAVVTYVLVPAV